MFSLNEYLRRGAAIDRNPERLLNNYCKNDDTISEGLNREINFSPLYE